MSRTSVSRVAATTVSRCGVMCRRQFVCWRQSACKLTAAPLNGRITASGLQCPIWQITQRVELCSRFSVVHPVDPSVPYFPPSPPIQRDVPLSLPPSPPHVGLKWSLAHWITWFPVALLVLLFKTHGPVVSPIGPPTLFFLCHWLPHVGTTSTRPLLNPLTFDILCCLFVCSCPVDPSLVPFGSWFPAWAHGSPCWLWVSHWFPCPP